METETATEMEQLLSMGFSRELATQALVATAGKSVLEAADWILTHQNPKPLSTTSNPMNQHQPKLNRFFQSNPVKPSGAGAGAGSSSPTTPSPPQTAAATGAFFKRPKLSSLPDHHQPLSERMRPRTIDDIVGQDHLLSDISVIRSSITCNRLPSLLFWGPPGSGKTSLVRAISNSLSASYHFISLSAVTSGVKEIREAVDNARKMSSKHGKRTLLFVDEVHRFNKSQQDSFLPIIEDGTVVFMGATTENPSFHLITPLLSRCRLLTLRLLNPHHVEELLRLAACDAEKGLCQSVGGTNIEVNDDAIEFISSNCDGDARVALNALEISALTAAARNGDVNDKTVVILDDAREALQSKHLAYDKDGEEHYNLISALHKSMRGSDANASIYWLARMLEGGEEPLYIARRLIRFASEDVGLADPSALNQAVSCYQSCHFIGMPECNVILAQCVAYLALAPKSVAVYRAIGAAQKVVRESVGQNEGVPLHLRNAPTKLMKELGYGKGYIYPPDTNYSSTQSYLPPSIAGYKFLNWPEDCSTSSMRDGLHTQF